MKLRSKNIAFLLLLEAIPLLLAFARGGIEALAIVAGASVILLAQTLILVAYVRRKSGPKPVPTVHNVDDDNWKEDILAFISTAPKGSTLVTHLHSQWKFAWDHMTKGAISRNFNLELGNKPAWMEQPDVYVLYGARGFDDVNRFFKRARAGDELVVTDPKIRRFAIRRRYQYGLRGMVIVRAPRGAELPAAYAPPTQHEQIRRKA